MNTFKHTGKLGDVIYALPAIEALGGGHLYLSDNAAALALPPEFHPKGALFSTTQAEEMAEFLRRTVPFLTGVSLWNREPATYDLDRFRTIRNPRHHLAKRYGAVFDLKLDLTRPWLAINDPLHISDIVINHSMRYFRRNDGFQWHLLKPWLDRCVFLGHEEEYKSFSKYSGLEMRRIEVSLHDFARAIQGSRLYIGNQSFGFALAESLKKPRILQFTLREPNCLPQTACGHLKLTAGLLEEVMDKACGGRQPSAQILTDSRNAWISVQSYLFQTASALKRQLRGIKD